jgi:hypothetical protein
MISWFWPSYEGPDKICRSIGHDYECFGGKWRCRRCGAPLR